MFILAEDQLGAELVSRLCADILQVPDAIVLNHDGGIGSVRSKFSSANQLAEREYVICMVDLDQNNCIVGFRDDFLSRTAQTTLASNMLFVAAVREAESWILADVNGLAQFLAISPAKIDPNSENNTLDPKEYLLNLAKSSRDQRLKSAILPNGNSKIGLGYNREMTGFVREQWDPIAASGNNASLHRLIQKLRLIAE